MSAVYLTIVKVLAHALATRLIQTNWLIVEVECKDHYERVRK